MDRRNRREALKLLAGGTATAVGASLIQTSTAFADGGTRTHRPTCPNAASVVNWSISNHRIVVAIAPGNPGCSSGWTLTTQVSFAVDSDVTSLEVRDLANTTVLASGGGFGPFVPVVAGLLSAQVTGSGGADIPDGTDVDIRLIVRRVCTANANPARKAWCCTRYRADGVVVYGTPDEWGGDDGGNMGNGTGNLTIADGCLAP